MYELTTANTKGTVGPVKSIKGFANDKIRYLYKSLLVKTKTAFLSRKLILLAILLHGQFIHYTQIILHPNIQLFNAQQRAFQSFLRNFLV